ncbi:ADP-ribosylhydrolase ARH3-like isoform X2 [Haliotis rufescens]|uniref:ADP-ribosylhydrolase ARH3-like isoform X1 n=1 Tax=Haliotis rufescens TaxID=6454 RepID=UPI00201ECD2A|nr:ADP-ribosylhydrolase ARH3-like isoform X1 [Haliotis rufescens]XP_048237427.1 ADP-ribosylhydrolase ARH3-like isoform X2 [Haliotis rufescens]
MATLSRFRGSLVGAVLGDCIGAIYECEGNVKLKDVLKTVKDLETNFKKLKDGEKLELLPFTDDTAMARSVAASLVAKKGFDVKDMAKRFTDEFHLEPNRGYGGSVGAVFAALRKDDPDDVFEPARKQFDGQGSYGNGGAMRIAPAALGCLKQGFENLKTVTVDISQITHSHPQAIQGAVLQSSAVDLALREDQSEQLDRDRFLDKLIERIKPMEEEELKKSKETVTDSPSPKRKAKRKSDTVEMPYCHKLEKMKEFLRKDVSVSTIEEELGNDISALGSVPAAVYSFLKAYKEIPGIKTDSAFKRTIIYAISLGGDTDTIATMAAAMAGAYYGYEAIPESWQASCEGVEDAMKFAQDLLELQ